MQWLILLSALLVTTSALAVDGSASVTKNIKSGYWQVMEFSGQEQAIYRLSSDATNYERMHIVFDFIPSDKCKPTPAVVIVRHDSYNPDLDDGFVPFTYKLPSQPQEFNELTKTVMQQGDTFAFFQFHSLTANKILKSQDKGNLVLWIPKSANGKVKQSDNIYFSLDGFSGAYERASKLCNANH